jgi:hypothetical protein
MLPESNMIGTLPESFGAFTDLWRLNLAGNSLSGSIPSSITACTVLYVLTIDGNHFSGGPLPALDFSYLSNSGAIFRANNAPPKNAFGCPWPPGAQTAFGVTDRQCAVACPGGHFSDRESQVCTACATGQFSSNATSAMGISACTLCPAGKFQQSADGLQSCSGVCPAGTFSFPGFAAQVCPKITVTCDGSSANLPAGQCQAWADLYDSTGGDSWTGLCRTRTDPCSCSGNRWFSGVAESLCNDGNTAIVEVELSNSRLVGTLPESMGAFADLEILSLHTNSLSGSIPASAVAWTRLSSFKVDSNRFSGGPLPAIEFYQKGGRPINGQVLNSYVVTNTFSCPWPPGAQTAFGVTDRQCAVACPGGRFSDRESQVCTACATGQFSSNATSAMGISACTLCPAGKFQQSADGLQSCSGVCPAGTFSNPGATSSVVCRACNIAAWCVGSGGQCSPSRSGVGCAACAAGYAQFQGDCAKCPGNAEAMAVPALVLLAVALCVMRKLKGAAEAAIRCKLHEHELHELRAVANAGVADDGDVAAIEQRVTKLAGKAKGSMALMQQVR